MDKEKAKALSKTLACYKELQENNSVNLIELHTADGQKHGIGNPEAIKLLLSVAVIELERQLRTAQFGDIPESLENSREYKAAKQLEYAMNDLETVIKKRISSACHLIKMKKRSLRYRIGKTIDDSYLKI